MQAHRKRGILSPCIAVPPRVPLSRPLRPCVSVSVAVPVSRTVADVAVEDTCRASVLCVPRLWAAPFTANGTRLLVATAEGVLLTYDVVGPGPNVNEPFQVTLSASKKAFSKKPIEQLAVIEELDVVLSLSGTPWPGSCARRRALIHAGSRTPVRRGGAGVIAPHQMATLASTISPRSTCAC